jgi:hypothetical protein
MPRNPGWSPGGSVRVTRLARIQILPTLTVPIGAALRVGVTTRLETRVHRGTAPASSRRTTISPLPGA